MTGGGWIFLLISWGVILSLVGFCYYRTLRSGSPNCDDDNDTVNID